MIDGAGGARQADTGRSGAMLRATIVAVATIAAPFAEPARAEAPAPAAPARSPSALVVAAGGDIIVTAQRRAENILTVPLSVASYASALMDRQGIRRIDDIARLTPDLRFARTAGVTGNLGTTIAIRGIASDVGAATTAIYIDDTPIQIRSVGYFSGNPYPRVFDLERVEVLRGPQGTLFGAGAEGGAVRFLTPQPSFADALHVYARAEVAGTRDGADSYEGGLAVGGRVGDTLAVRASGWVRRDGGYIDAIVPQTTTRTRKDINAQDTSASRLAVSWRPVPALTITPAIYDQRVDSGGRDQFWEGNGDIGSGDYVTGHTNAEASHDRFTIPSLKVDYAFGRVSLIANGAYFDRRQGQILDYADYLSFLRSGSPFGAYTNQLATNAFADLATHQRDFTQEARLQSFDPGNLIDWTVGGFHSRARQHFTNYSASGLIPGAISRGFPQYLGRYNLFERIDADDRQTAGFASVDVKPIAGVRITLGGRYTRIRFDFVNTRVGPVNGGVITIVDFARREHAFTPKLGASWQVTPDDFVYATASKGFRQGGAQPIVDKAFCASDIRALGVVDSPSDYKSDSLWSYEAGSKNSWFGGTVIVDANAYLVKWRNIQQAIRLPTCGFTFIGNLGDATATGADVSVQVTPVRGVVVGATVGYNRSAFDSDVYFDGDTADANPGVLVRRKHQRLGGPSWTGAAFAQIDRPLADGAGGYARVDYSFAGKGIAAAPQGVFGYDPGLPALAGVDDVTARVGVRFARLDLSAFVDNAADQHKPLSRNHDGIGSPLYYDETYRPRTIGVTLQYRY